MADLLYTARTNFSGAKIFLSSVLVRRDISNKALQDFNTQLELMCFNFGVEFVDANSCVRRRDLTRDGVHFRRRATSRLGSLFVDVVVAALQQQGTSVQPEAFQSPDLSSGSESVVNNTPELPDVSQNSGE